MCGQQAAWLTHLGVVTPWELQEGYAIVPWRGGSSTEAKKGRETTLVSGDKVISRPISRSKPGFNPSILEHDPQE